MTDPAAIIAAFERHEAKADRVTGPDHSAILDAVAREFGIPREECREIMLDHWSAPMGAG